MSSRRRVLVIEEDAEIRQLFCEILESEGYVTPCANSGAAGLHECERGAPDLVILDWLRQGMTAAEFIAVFREKTAPKRVPILLSSANPRIETLFKEIGADGCVAKPVSVDEFLAVVEQSIRSSL